MDCRRFGVNSVADEVKLNSLAFGLSCSVRDTDEISEVASGVKDDTVDLFTGFETKETGRSVDESFPVSTAARSVCDLRGGFARLKSEKRSDILLSSTFSFILILVLLCDDDFSFGSAPVDATCCTSD